MAGEPLTPLFWRDVVLLAASEGRLMTLLKTLPRARWSDRDPDGQTLLHYACQGDNATAARALFSAGLHMNACCNGDLATPAHVAAASTQPLVLEVLCAAGADVRAPDCNGHAPLDYALDSWERERFPLAAECLRVLVANGVRLASAADEFAFAITPALVAFERGVLQCRAVVVALLRVKRAGRLVHWDKYLLAALAVDVWSTRMDDAWQLAFVESVEYRALRDGWRDEDDDDDDDD